MRFLQAPHAPRMASAVFRTRQNLESEKPDETGCQELSTEVQRKAMEWERQIESLDAKDSWGSAGALLGSGRGPVPSTLAFNLLSHTGH